MSGSAGLGRSARIGLLVVLATAALVRLHHFRAPLADSLQAKQVYVANKARSIARPPFNPMRNTLDFLDERGKRTTLTEEVPLYTGLLGAGFRLFGERAWVGHGLSLIGTLAGLLAFFDLVRGEWRERSALIATALLSAAPLSIFYGRAVLPDPWMLAGMLGAAACYRRGLAGGGRRWLVGAALCGLMGAMFKYFGLMVLVPMLEMTWRRRRSWRGLIDRRFLAVSVVMVAPLALWMAAVFARSPNPVASGWVGGQVYPYLLVQAPGVLARRDFWTALLQRLPIRDCGPFLAGLMAVGGVIACQRRSLVPPGTMAWTLMGLGFFLLLGPKLRDHDYYGLMLLPAAAIWGTLGLEGLLRRVDSAPRRDRLAAASVLAVLALQSPWVRPALFRQDAGKLALARAIRDLGPAGGRVVAIGPGIELPTVVHYSGREGWPVHLPRLPADWRDLIQRYRRQGATCAAVYFEPKATTAQRDSYQGMIAAFPRLDHQTRLETRSGGPAEFYLLDLREPRVVQETGARRSR